MESIFHSYSVFKFESSLYTDGEEPDKARTAGSKGDTMSMVWAD